MRRRALTDLEARERSPSAAYVGARDVTFSEGSESARDGSLPLQKLFKDLAGEFEQERLRRLGRGEQLDDADAPRLLASPQLDEAVGRLLDAYLSASYEDWKLHASFSELGYGRSRVGISRDVEVLVLSWTPGQASSVHNHGGGRCWLGCIAGEAHEERYLLPEIDDENADGNAGGTGGAFAPASTSAPPRPLTYLNEARLFPKQRSYIDDSMALHSVSCPRDAKGPGAVTIHIYAPPITKGHSFSKDGRRLA